MLEDLNNLILVESKGGVVSVILIWGLAVSPTAFFSGGPPSLF